MERTTHEQAAADLAHTFITGDEATRRHIAADCEEQGILAALVVLALPEALRGGFITAMRAGLADR